ncbi:hypothetical protein AUJ84_01460 [Candidatus Pacearchaeota archaeon CG1_02_32_132]|nr:MAG: hypothetical protein AUJ84_01460 [Candidatus Pacearchaeota archaeon CG1_02_32_132]
MGKLVSKKIAKSLVNDIPSSKAYDYAPLYHGTSVEAVKILFETGSLASSRFFNFSGNHPVYSGYLFFAPNCLALAKHPIRDKLCPELSRPSSIRHAESYAGIHQKEEYFFDIFGREFVGEINSSTILAGSVSRKTIEAEGFDFTKADEIGWRNVLRRAEELKGVLIGVNNKFLNKFKLEESVEGNKEVKVYAPEGVSIDYIGFVQPLGDLESKRLHEIIKSL